MNKIRRVACWLRHRKQPTVLITRTNSAHRYLNPTPQSLRRLEHLLIQLQLIPQGYYQTWYDVQQAYR